MAAVILIAVAAAVATNQTTELASYETEVDMVKNTANLSVGIDTDTSQLDFGRLPPRTVSAEKTLAFQNKEQKQATFEVYTTGNITPHIVIEPSKLTLAPGERANVSVSLETEEDVRAGYYEGTVHVTKQASWLRGIW